MRKQLIALGCMLCISFMLTACSNPENSESTQEIGTSTKEATYNEADGNESTAQPETPTPTPEPAETPTPTPEPTETPTPTPEPVHEHSYSETIVTEASCNSIGIKLYSCSCGHSYEEEYKDFNNHVGNEYISANREPTCTEYGVVNYVCEACGCVSRFEEIPALGHTPDSFWIYHHGTGTYRLGCARCNTLIDETSVEPEGVEIRDFYPRDGLEIIDPFPR